MSGPAREIPHSGEPITLASGVLRSLDPSILSDFFAKEAEPFREATKQFEDHESLATVRTLTIEQLEQAPQRGLGVLISSYMSFETRIRRMEEAVDRAPLLQALLDEPLVKEVFQKGQGNLAAGLKAKFGLEIAKIGMHYFAKP